MGPAVRVVCGQQHPLGCDNVRVGASIALLSYQIFKVWLTERTLNWFEFPFNKAFSNGLK